MPEFWELQFRHKNCGYQRPSANVPEIRVDCAKEVAAVLDEVLNLRGRAGGFCMETRLLGSIPELDSMAVVSIITALEERFGFAVADDELDASTFQTLGSLVGFVKHKVDG